MEALHYIQAKEDKKRWQSLLFNTDELMLSELLLHFYGYFGFLVNGITVVNKTIREISDHDEIKKFKALDAIVCDKKFICDNAVVLIKYVNEDVDVHESFTATLVLEAKEENDECLMARATITMPPIDRQGLRALPHSSSVMLSIDKMEKGQKRAFYDYMLKEAIDTDSDNLYTLNPVELQILSLHNPSPARDLFFGNKYFYDKRYYNALLHLESAYEKLNSVFFRLDNYWKKEFFDVCYKIGYCFCDMGNYSSAIFYLELADTQNYIIYTTEYVNALVNSKDIRSISTIDRVLESVQRQISDAAVNGEEADEALANFYNFLRRRKGYAFIDLGDLNSAEDLFKKLVNEPNNHDYAVNELKHIAKLREQQNHMK